MCRCEPHGSPSANRAAVWNGTPESWQDLTLVPAGNWTHAFANAIWREDNTLYVLGTAFNVDVGRNEALLWQRTLGDPCFANCDQPTQARS